MVKSPTRRAAAGRTIDDVQADLRDAEHELVRLDRPAVYADLRGQTRAQLLTRRNDAQRRIDELCAELAPLQTVEQEAAGAARRAEARQAMADRLGYDAEYLRAAATYAEARAAWQKASVDWGAWQPSETKGAARRDAYPARFRDVLSKAEQSEINAADAVDALAEAPERLREMAAAIERRAAELREESS